MLRDPCKVSYVTPRMGRWEDGKIREGGFYYNSPIYQKQVAIVGNPGRSNCYFYDFYDFLFLSPWVIILRKLSVDSTIAKGVSNPPVAKHEAGLGLLT